MIIFSNLNQGKVDECVGRLTIALEKFNVNISYFTFDAQLTCYTGWKRSSPNQGTRGLTRAVEKDTVPHSICCRSGRPCAQ